MSGKKSKPSPSRDESILNMESITSTSTINATAITFLGTAAATPGPGHDTASFLLNGRYLVDAGWCAVLRMQSFGFDPLALECLFLTHCHHDHYLGLPALIFYRAMNAPSGPPLTIFGPVEDIEKVVRLSLDLLQTSRFPELNAEAAVDIRPLAPGDHFENDDFRIETAASVHPVPALCYRFTDLRTGSVVAFTGDTAPAPHLVDCVRGADLLITEASYGPGPIPAENRWGHQAAPEAAQLAVDGNVTRLALVHCRERSQQATLTVAQKIFPNAFWPHDGETIRLTPVTP